MTKTTKNLITLLATVLIIGAVAIGYDYHKHSQNGEDTTKQTIVTPTPTKSVEETTLDQIKTDLENSSAINDSGFGDISQEVDSLEVDNL